MMLISLPSAPVQNPAISGDQGQRSRLPGPALVRSCPPFPGSRGSSPSRLRPRRRPASRPSAREDHRSRSVLTCVRVPRGASLVPSGGLRGPWGHPTSSASSSTRAAQYTKRAVGGAAPAAGPGNAIVTGSAPSFPRADVRRRDPARDTAERGRPGRGRPSARYDAMMRADDEGTGGPGLIRHPGSLA